MKLIMTLLVRDEIDIIASCIEFHLAAHVDFIVATDNRSQDGTPDVLREYERKGVLHFIYEDDDTHEQAKWVNRMAQLATARFDADWIINNDADEFWYPHNGDLKSTLSSLPPTTVAATVPRANFLPRPMRPDQFFADVLTVREREPRNLMGEPLPGKTCHRASADIETVPGNHTVRQSGRAIAGAHAPITVFHYPIRSRDQFHRKIKNGGSSYANNSRIPSHIGAVIKKLYEKQITGTLDEFYDSIVLDDPKVEKGVADGSLISDERVKVVLNDLKGKEILRTRTICG